jgi:WD40 repeat protein
MKKLFLLLFALIETATIAFSQPLPVSSDTLWVNRIAPRRCTYSSFIDSGKTIIAAVDNCVYILDKQTGKFVDSLEKASSNINYLALSADNSRIATIFTDGIYVWDYQTKKIIKHFSTSELRIGWLSFSPDGRYLVSCSDSLQVYDFISNSKIVNIKLYTDAVAYSPDGKYLALSIPETPPNNLSNIVLYDTKTWKFFKVLDASCGHCRYLSFSKDGKYLCVTKETDTSTVWDMDSYTLLNSYPPDKIKGNFLRITFSALNKYLIMAGGNEIGMQLWDLKADTLVKNLDYLNDGFNGQELCIDDSFTSILIQDGATILLFQPKWLLTDVVSNDIANYNLNIRYNNNQLVISAIDNTPVSNISIYDLQGRTIFQKAEPAFNHEITLPELSGNIIFIKAKVNGKMMTAKYFLNN